MVSELTKVKRRKITETNTKVKQKTQITLTNGIAKQL